jgi:hypothetical protein
MRSRLSHPGILLALTCALSACVMPTANKSLTPIPTEGSVKGTVRGTTKAPVSPRPASSPVRESATPATPTAPVEVVAVESPLPSPPALNPESTRIENAVEQKLLTIARVGFNQNRSGLISDNGLGLLSNNSLGIIANNGVGVIDETRIGLFAGGKLRIRTVLTTDLDATTGLVLQATFKKGMSQVHDAASGTSVHIDEFSASAVTASSASRWAATSAFPASPTAMAPRPVSTTSA